MSDYNTFISVIADLFKTAIPYALILGFTGILYNMFMNAVFGREVKF